MNVEQRMSVYEIVQVKQKVKMHNVYNANPDRKESISEIQLGVPYTFLSIVKVREELHIFVRLLLLYFEVRALAV